MLQWGRKFFPTGAKQGAQGQIKLVHRLCRIPRASLLEPALLPVHAFINQNVLDKKAGNPQSHSELRTPALNQAGSCF